MIMYILLGRLSIQNLRRGSFFGRSKSKLQFTSIFLGRRVWRLFRPEGVGTPALHTQHQWRLGGGATPHHGV
ncbi:hypothetical protein HanIR_Chr11g0514321 [Helianthus annuus]|nr:hypothetical protein HanIR_Chr11g0514321 [Helianthus annuus]